MKMQDYVVEVNGNQTPWRLFEPDGSKAEWAVLWLQGFASTIEGHSDGVIRMAEATKTTFVMLNYAGHGNNPIPLDEATRAQQFDEVCAVYDELVNRGYTKIMVSGGSFGAYMATLLCGKRDLASMTLRAPAIYNDAEYELPYAETISSQEHADNTWRLNVTPETESVALRNVMNYYGDTYVIEHENDEVISKNIPEAYAGVARHPNYIIIRDCTHSPRQMHNPQKYFEIIESWACTIILNTQRNTINSK